MGDVRVVVGAGPDALRAAAALAASGCRVALLQQGPRPGGVEHPEIPLGTGLLRDLPARRALIEEALGALVEYQPSQRAIATGRRVVVLPASPTSLMRASEDPGALVRSRLGSRLRHRFERILGGGSEVRTYRDWVVAKLGEVAYEQLFADYAARRFGIAGAELGASVARLVHASPRPARMQVLGGGHDQAEQRAVDLIEAAGGTVRTGVEVDSIELGSDGKVSVLRLRDGSSLALDGQLWVARSPAVVAEWLQGMDAAVREDARRLQSAWAVQITLRGEVYHLPEEVHVIARGAPFYRVFQAYGIESAAVFHATSTLAPAHVEHWPPRFAEAARSLGLGAFSPDEARLQIVPDWNPIWTVACHARLRRVLIAWEGLGIRAIGRSGTMSRLDPAEEIDLVATLEAGGQSQREIHRQRLDPPVVGPPGPHRLRDFVER